jgi:TP901 family phage tail tape measure protein
MKAQIIPSVFTAVDKFSSVMDKMSKNTARSSGIMERNLRKVSAQAMNVGRISGAIGLGIIAPLGLAAKSAVEFEKSMAGVAKVANVALGTKEFEALGNEAKKLAINLAMSTTDSANLMAGLAQGGVAVKDLEKVSMIAGKVGVAFDISGQVAGESFVKTKNALGITIDQTSLLMDQINALSNTYAASAPEVLAFMSAGGSGAARAAGATGEALAAFGTQFISMGKSSAESATIMERFVKTSLKVDGLRSVFEKAGGGSKGMMAIIEKGSKLSGRAQDKYFSQFGEYGISIQLLAKNMGELKEKVDFVSDAQKNAGAVQSEFNNVAQTSAFKLAQAKARFESLAISIGSAVLPIINNLIERLTPMIEKFSSFISKNKSLVVLIVKVAAVLGGLAIAISVGAFAVGIATKGMLLYNTALKYTKIETYKNLLAMALVKVAYLANNLQLGFMIAKMTAATIAQGLFNAVLSANPIGLIVIGVAALVAGIVLLYKNWDAFREAFTMENMLIGIRKFGAYVFDFMIAPLRLVLKAASFLPGIGDKATNALKSLDNMRNKISGEFQVTGKKEIVDTSKTAVEKTTKNITESNKKMTLEIKGAPQGSMLNSRPIGGTGLNQLATN